MATQTLQLLVVATLLVGTTTAASINLAVPRVGDANQTLLKLLNGLKDSVINPMIQKNVPSQIPVNAGKSGSADAGCIVPGPFHSCICHASANYNVEFENVDGCNTALVNTFTEATILKANLTSYTVAVAGKVSINKISASGDAHAGVDACGIKPSASGTASTDATASGDMKISAIAKLNTTGGCLDIAVDSTTIELTNMQLSNTKVNIDLSGIHIDVGNIIDLITQLVPDLAKDIGDAITPLVSKLLPSAITSALPCVPL